MYQTASAFDAAAKAQAAEYDSDDNLIVPDRLGKNIEPLKPLDHDQIEYPEFNKDFYEPAAEIATLTEAQVGEVGCCWHLKLTQHQGGISTDIWVASPVLCICTGSREAAAAGRAAVGL